ncbi:MAG: RimK domain-containing protein, partial [Sciscionella sp.]
EFVGLDVTAHPFQQWIPKSREARVIVIGDDLFAVEIIAGSENGYLDWRADYPSNTYRPTQPPDAVQRGTRQLMAKLELAYGALDFVITPEGDWVFLEINAGGQYGWLEEATCLPISAALAGLLAEGEAT